MTSYIVGLRHKARAKPITIEAEDTLIAALRAKHEIPKQQLHTSARQTVAAIIGIRMNTCRTENDRVRHTLLPAA